MENSQKVVPQERTLLQTLLHYTSILLKYKIMIILITATVAFLSVGFSVISLKLPSERSPLPNYYEAYAVIVFQEGGSAAGMSSMLEAFGVESPQGGMSSPQLAMQILRSRSFLDQVVEKFDLINRYNIENNIKNRSRAIVMNSSQYEYIRESGTLTITYTSTDPVLAADIVNYQVALLQEWFLREGVTTRSSQLTLMEEKLEALAGEIEDIEDEIEAFQKEHGVLDILELATSLGTMLTDLRTSLNQVELEISTYTEYSNIEDPALISLRNRQNNIINQIRRIENGYTGSDGRRMPSQAELPQLALDFSHLQANLTLQTQLYRTLSERYEVTKLAVGEAGGFSVLELAEVPEEKAGPSRGKLCIYATFGAFAGSIVLALLINIIRNIIRDPKNKKLIKGEEV